MEYLNFSLIYFALLAGAALLAVLYMRTTGAQVFGLTAERATNVALSFGAVHAVVTVASLLVPPTEPVMIALLGTAAALVLASMLFRAKLSSSQRDYLWLVGSIFAVSGISFESAQWLAEVSMISATLPVAIILLTSVTIMRTALRLPGQPRAAA